jgi:hypothetical protein
LIQDCHSSDIQKHCVEKLEKYHTAWLLLKKNMGRHSSDAQHKRELDFTSQLDSLFDIAHADALTMIRIEEDRKFLFDQRADHKMFMLTEDKELTKRKERTKQKQQMAEAWTERAIAASAASARSSLTVMRIPILTLAARMISSQLQ